MSATTTTVDLKRADFERFVKLRFPDLSLESWPYRPDRYHASFTQKLWESWCAARRA